jgi:hypothetical protein
MAHHIPQEGGGNMSHTNDRRHLTAEQLSEEVNTPSTSAMESNENDLQFKGDKDAFTPSKLSSGYEEEASQQHRTETASDTNPAWFETVEAAALQARSTFPDQIDYYDPQTDEIV